MKAIKAELSAHLGGTPSIAQTMLIERIAVLMLRMELMDRRSLKNGDLTEKDTREYLAWNGAVSRSLRHLGLKGASAAPPTLAELFAGKSAV